MNASGREPDSAATPKPVQAAGDLVASPLHPTGPTVIAARQQEPKRAKIVTVETAHDSDPAPAPSVATDDDIAPHVSQPPADAKPLGANRPAADADDKSQPEARLAPPRSKSADSARDSQSVVSKKSEQPLPNRSPGKLDTLDLRAC